MIRPFGLTDIILMRNLQRCSATLALEHALTHPRAPLWNALTAPWPWTGFGIATYVLADAQQGGFVQLMKRPTRPEADVLHLAPALPGGPTRDEAIETVWHALLDHCVLAAAGHGVQRIFANIPDGGPEEACLKDIGFSLYARETIYRLSAIPPLPLKLAVGFRRQGPQDSWALQRLYARSTPRLIQHAEGAAASSASTPTLSWWEPHNWQGYVWEPAGEVRGAVQIHRGRTGHWLRLWGASQLSPREVRSLIEQALRLLADPRPAKGAQPLPIYTAVRDYESDLGGILTGFGFAPYADRVRFVKHTVAPIREAVAAPAVATLEATPKVVARTVRKG